MEPLTQTKKESLSDRPKSKKYLFQEESTEIYFKNFFEEEGKTLINFLLRVKAGDMWKAWYRSAYSVKKASDTIRIRIGTEVHSLPVALKRIVDQIEEAKEILNYEYSWDEEGAEPTDLKTFAKACDFLIKYARWIYKVHNVIINTPYIDILNDGSISVHWETDKAQLLIIFNKEEHFEEGEEELAYFYAQLNKDNIPLNSAIKPGASVNESIALWMKENLS